MNVNKQVTKLFGVFILILVGVSLMPEIFTQLAALENATGVPSWLSTALIVVVGAGLLFLIWRAVE